MPNGDELYRQLLEKYPDRPVIPVTLHVEGHSVIDEIIYGALLVQYDQDGKICMIKYSYDLQGLSKQHWTVPGGKLDPDETLEECAVRETYEDTGITAEVDGLYKVFHITHLDNGKKISEWFCPVFTGRIIERNDDWESNEITEMKRFGELPEGFAGSLGVYQDCNDLFQFIESKRKG